MNDSYKWGVFVNYPSSNLVGTFASDEMLSNSIALCQTMLNLGNKSIGTKKRYHFYGKTKIISIPCHYLCNFYHSLVSWNNQTPLDSRHHDYKSICQLWRMSYDRLSLNLLLSCLSTAWLFGYGDQLPRKSLLMDRKRLRKEKKEKRKRFLNAIFFVSST